MTLADLLIEMPAMRQPLKRRVGAAGEVAAGHLMSALGELRSGDFNAREIAAHATIHPPLQAALDTPLSTGYY